MPISFSNIPADLRIPLYWVEVDPSRAGLPVIHQPSLMVGTMTPNGKTLPNVAVAVGTQAQADEHFGIGSEVARMFRTFYANNFANEVWGLGVPEPPGATAATGAILVTLQQTEAGTIHLYIAGRHVPINIAASDTPADVANAIADAIAEQSDLPVTAKVGTTSTGTGIGTSSGTTLTITAPTGTIKVGDIVTGPGVPAGTNIVAQVSGPTGGAGVYTTDTRTTAALSALDFNLRATGTGTAAGTTLTVTGVTAAGGNINIGDSVTGVGVPPGTTITAQISGTPQGDGDYTTSAVTTASAATLKFGVTATATGTASGVVLTVTASTGTISIGASVTGTGVSPDTMIVNQQSGTPGGDGVYLLNLPADAAGTPLVFGATDNAVILTATWKGVNGNDIRIDQNYYGSIGGEVSPIGLGLQLPATGMLTGGVGVPVFDTAISNLGEKNYEYVAMPYTDSTSLNAWELEYGFEDVGRWGWRRQLYGHVFSARRDTYANLITFGNTRNSGITSVMGVERTSPSPVFDWTAAYVAKAQRALINDPARPLQTLVLNTVKLAPLQDRFNTIEINALAGNGIATQKAGSDNQPMISRETTTYQLNLYGYTDDAYELVTTLATLARLIRNQRYVITSKYPRVKLADDGTRFGPGQAIVTPGIIKGELIAEYVQDMWVGLVENIQAFKANLLVERDPNDPNRVNVLYGPDLINQLRIFAVLAQFRLQYDRGIDTQIIGPNPATIGTTGILPPVGV